MRDMKSIFEVRNLILSYKIDDEYYDALKGINLDIFEGKITGIIGESGCGKSTLGLTLLGLIGENSKVSGKIFYKGRDLFSLSERELINYRRKNVGYIHQNPFESFNPIVKIRKQLLERCVEKDNFKEKVEKLFRVVNLEDVHTVLEKYPFELSGGQNQRISIVSALLPEPEVIIADEPTTSLDVTVQSMILSHLLKIKEEFGLTLILISHDVQLVSVFTDYVIVLYGGKVVEAGETKDVMEDPKHPYTEALLNSMIVMEGEREPVPIPGNVPSIKDFFIGCPFEPRCKYKMEICGKNFPERKEINENRYFYCFRDL